MNRILAFIVEHMSFLWQGARFRIVSSMVSTSNGGDAVLLAESDGVRLRFVCDRGQLFLDLQPASARTDEWYSIDLLRRMYTGQREASAVLDASYAAFLEEHLDELEQRFAPAAWDETLAELAILKQRRAQEMFD
ncbi:hypothetical protein ARHIZOSPH14_25220 [Agromyces rhizosphaerae]|uniref:Uncharacterized protein n=1 Tax=Agromyces rhizosphaerae TaxID=88374 RepID=A0A9W6CZ32_9MICO|nr:hypothetical protein [Agromyces rhizosphaerae]GLI28280.1 hypothetical protein ARHIZOSPH14_25220 [Agromyces rhizosphaerae]